MADNSFSEYLRVVNTLPKEAQSAPPMEMPEDLSPTERRLFLEVRTQTSHLRRELDRRPVNKVVCLDYYSKIRESAQELADSRFYRYMDSFD